MLYWTPDLWHLISDTGTWHVILDTWSLTLDIWHRYLTCYHLTPVPDTWYMTLDNWRAITYLTCFHMVLVHLTWCCDTWRVLLLLTPVLLCNIHDYHFYGDFAWLLYCYQIFGTPKLLCSCILEPLKKGDSRYYTPVDPRNWIIMNVGLLCIPCGHYHWTNHNK